jgi:hypothetical protein
MHPCGSALVATGPVRFLSDKLDNEIHCLLLLAKRGAMFHGRLEAIYICQHKRADLRQVLEVEAVPGSGLAGDRYFNQQGTFSKPGSPDREVTLIEMETIERGDSAARRASPSSVWPDQSRWLVP